MLSFWWPLWTPTSVFQIGLPVSASTATRIPALPPSITIWRPFALETIGEFSRS